MSYKTKTTFAKMLMHENFMLHQKCNSFLEMYNSMQTNLDLMNNFIMTTYDFSGNIPTFAACVNITSYDCSGNKLSCVMTDASGQFVPCNEIVLANNIIPCVLPPDLSGSRPISQLPLPANTNKDLPCWNYPYCYPYYSPYYSPYYYPYYGYGYDYDSDDDRDINLSSIPQPMQPSAPMHKDSSKCGPYRPYFPYNGYWPYRPYWRDSKLPDIVPHSPMPHNITKSQDKSAPIHVHVHPSK